jgi:hypothetical protein
MRIKTIRVLLCEPNWNPGLQDVLKVSALPKPLALPRGIEPLFQP